MSSIKKVVLAYSGGLDTSAIVPWLKENYGCEVIAFVADVGQGAEELEGVEAKAIASGASECYVVDLKDEIYCLLHDPRPKLLKRLSGDNQSSRLALEKLPKVEEIKISSLKTSKESTSVSETIAPQE